MKKLLIILSFLAIGVLIAPDSQTKVPAPTYMKVCSYTSDCGATGTTYPWCGSFCFSMKCPPIHLLTRE
jgi:hypothetical protein